MVAGLALGNAYELEVHLTQELLYAVFLPGLLFEGLRRVEDWRRGAALGWIAGTLHWMVAVHWVVPSLYWTVTRPSLKI